MSVSYWLDQKTRRNNLKCDYLVVGSGIAGLSTAFWLEKQFPSAKIIILERFSFGIGASSRNGGFITCGSIEHFARLLEQHGPELALKIWNFSDLNRELLKEHVIQSNAEEVEFNQSGIATLAHDDAQAKRLEHTAAIMQKANINVSPVTAREIESNYGLRGYRSGVLFQGDGQIHPRLLLEKLRKKLRSTIIENEEVFALDATGAVTTQNLSVNADHIFLTVNAYLPLFAPEFAPYVKPQRGQVLVTAPIDRKISGPAYITHHLAYLRQLPKGELLIGGFRNSSLSTEETYADQITPEIQDSLENYIRHHFGQVEIVNRWSGTMGFTPDHQMLIGPHPSLPRISIMAGCSGHGMGLSFHAAKILAESITGREIPAHLRLDRIKL